MMVNGRDKIMRGADLTRTIGWLVDYIPVMIKSNNHLSLIEQVYSYKQQYIKIPSSGLSCNGMKYLSDDPSVRAQFELIPRAEFNINYIPPAFAVFEDVATTELPVHLISLGHEFAGEHQETRLSDIIWPTYIRIEVRGGVYVFTWIARDNVYQKSTIESTMSLWLNEIEKIVDAIVNSVTERATNISTSSLVSS